MSKIKRRNYIDIKREIDKKMGNKIVLDRIRHGEYKLMTGENDPSRGVNQMYAEKMEDEIKEMVEKINSDEDLKFSDSEVKNKSKDLQRQMKEGRKEMKISTRGKDVMIDEDEEEAEAGSEEKRKFFF